MKKLCILIAFVLIVPYGAIAKESSKEGDWDFRIAIYWINNFFTKPDEEKNKSSTGFLGLAFGLDYYHSEHSFINLGIAGAMDFFLPFPAAVATMPGTQYENMASAHISLSNNHKIVDFAIGYGLSYALNHWNTGCSPGLSGKKEEVCDGSIYEARRTHGSFGLIFPTSYQITENFDIGFAYRPTFYRPSIAADKFAYEHLISFVLGKQIF